MLTIRAFSLVLLLSFPFGFGFTRNFNSDRGCAIDPNGCSGRQLATQAGGEMDPNGGEQSDYSACLDPNGGCREQ